MTFFTPDALVSSHGIDFSRGIFPFQIWRLFLSPFLAPFDFSKSRPNFRNIGRTFEITVERSKFRLKVRILSRTFEIPVERSRFWPNVRDSGRTFETPAECSKLRPDVRKNGNKNWSLNPKTGFWKFPLK